MIDPKHNCGIECPHYEKHEIERLRNENQRLRDGYNTRDPDKALAAIAAFVRAVDEAVVDWVRGDKLRVDGILKTRETLRDLCQGYIPRLKGDDYAEHADSI